MSASELLSEESVWFWWQDAARRILKTGISWILIEASREPETGPCAYLKLRGGIARDYVRGPKKGQPNPRTARMTDTVILSRRQLRNIDEKVRRLSRVKVPA